MLLWKLLSLNCFHWSARRVRLRLGAWLTDLRFILHKKYLKGSKLGSGKKKKTHATLVLMNCAKNLEKWQKRSVFTPSLAQTPFFKRGRQWLIRDASHAESYFHRFICVINISLTHMWRWWEWVIRHKQIPLLWSVLCFLSSSHWRAIQHKEPGAILGFV